MKFQKKIGASRSAIATWINDLKDAGIIKTKKIGLNRYIEILDNNIRGVFLLWKQLIF